MVKDGQGWLRMIKVGQGWPKISDSQEWSRFRKVRKAKEVQECLWIIKDSQACSEVLKDGLGGSG